MPARVSKRLVGSLVACVVGAAACHGSASDGMPPTGDGGAPAHAVPLTGYASGSRLRARVLDGGGEPVRFEGFVDTKLGVRCDFAVAQDGVVRCLPTSDSSTYFADSACSQPLIVAAPGCAAPPPYVRLSSGPATFCAWEPRLHAGPDEVLAPSSPLGPVPGTLYSTNGSSCGPATSPPAASSTLYTAHVIAPGTFVAASEATDPRGARIGARVVLAQDGAAEVIGYFDERAHAPCDVIQESIGWWSDLCIPTTMAWASDWADAACTQVAADIGHQCPKPTIAVNATFMGNCTTEPMIHTYAIGASLATAYAGNGTGGCSAVAADPNGELYFATAGPIDPATLPAVSIEPIGSSALRTYFRTSPDGVPILPAGLGVLPNSQGALFRDVARDADCWATQLADGSWRCVPAAYVQLSDPRIFADAACTQEVVDAGDFSPPCPPTAPVVAVRVGAASCNSDAGSVESVYALGAPMPGGGTVYSMAQTGGPCLATSVPSGDRVYPLTGTIEPSTLPPITERTE